jgi:hypothetical protein
MNADTLKPHQRALRDLALRQLEAASETMARLQSVTDDLGDSEAVGDALDSTANAMRLLNDWFGTEPE